MGSLALGPNRVVLPAALQSRTQPGRVLEPGDQGSCQAPAAASPCRRTQANGARLPAPTPAMAGEVKPFLLAIPGAICRPLIVIYLG